MKKVKLTQVYVTNISTKTTTFPPQVNIEGKEKNESHTKCRNFLADDLMAMHVETVDLYARTDRK